MSGSNAAGEPGVEESTAESSPGSSAGTSGEDRDTGPRPADASEGEASATGETQPTGLSVEDQRKSLLNAVGGGRGALETSLPGLIFVTIFAVWHGVKLAAVVAALVGAVFLVVRLVRRETPQYAIGGFVGVLIAGLFAVSTGKATNYFLPKILKDLGFTVLYLVSVLVRWPLLGVILGPLLKENFAWRAHPARRRVYMQATLIWTAMFALRFGVLLVLYLLDNSVALGIAGVALGWPVFAVVAWATWLVIRRVPPVPAEPAPQ